MKMAVFAGILLSVVGVNAQDLETVKLEQLSQMIGAKSDQLRIVNFWASWCGPCIKEMPYLDEMDRREGVKVHLVSLDFIQDKDKAQRVLVKKGIGASAYILDEADADKYIEAISKEWSGAIPATLIIEPSGKRHFYERAFEKAELEELVNNLTTK